VLRAELRLLPEPQHRAVALLGFPDVAAAGDAVPAVNAHRPIQVEGLDAKLIRYESDERRNPEALKLLPDAGAWLMVELGGDTVDEARDAAQSLIDGIRHGNACVVTDDAHREQLQQVREAGLGTTARIPNGPDGWPGWEDSAVAPERLGDYLRDLTKLLDESGYGVTSLYGHFGHGCVHCSIPFDLLSADGVRDYRRFVQRAADLVVSHGGSLSGEHGDGQSRGELLTRMYGPEVVAAFGAFKAVFDPDGRMNPGKVVDPRPLDADLRLGPGYAPAEPDTYFRYSEDAGSFARAALRCAGVGECRRTSPGGAVMCPSYQVTREEEHSTRGRARLLFELARGETITDGWRSTAVAEALDLCLACKGCKHDCPVQVDMATYKVEFLAHHYAGRLRPRDHYSLGWLPLWARLAAAAPPLANAATHLPGVGTVAKRLAGVDPRRDVPRFAAARVDWWLRRRPPGGSGERGPVLLFPDTFSTFFARRVLVRGTGLLRRPRRAVSGPRRRRTRRDRRRVRLGPAVLPTHVRSRRRRLPAGRRHPLRRHHRMDPHRRGRRRPPPRHLRALRATPAPRRRPGHPQRAPPGMVPRPRPHRVDAPRRHTPARRRHPPPGPVRPRPRPDLQSPRRAAIPNRVATGGRCHRLRAVRRGGC
jgi:ferredoxin